MAVCASKLLVLPPRLKATVLETVRKDKEPAVLVEMYPLAEGIWSVVATVLLFRVRAVKLVGTEVIQLFS